MSDVNKDEMKGKGEQVKGRAQQAWGDVTGDQSDKLKGKGEEVKGKAREKLGEMKDDIRDEDRGPANP